VALALASQTLVGNWFVFVHSGCNSSHSVVYYTLADLLVFVSNH